MAARKAKAPRKVSGKKQPFTPRSTTGKKIMNKGKNAGTAYKYGKAGKGISKLGVKGKSSKKFVTSASTKAGYGAGRAVTAGKTKTGKRVIGGAAAVGVGAAGVKGYKRRKARKKAK